MNYYSKSVDVVSTLNGKKLYKTVESKLRNYKPKNIICVYFYKFNLICIKI